MDYSGSSWSLLDALDRLDVDEVRPDFRDMQFTSLMDQIYLNHLDPEKKNFPISPILLMKE